MFDARLVEKMAANKINIYLQKMAIPSGFG